MADPLYAGGPAGAENIFLQELPASFGASLRATAGEAFQTNPTTLLSQWWSREEVTPEQEDFKVDLAAPISPFLAVGKFMENRLSPKSRVVPAEEARERVAKEKLNLKISDEGIRESALNDLIERKHEERRRQDLIVRGPDGFWAGTSRFGAGLATSLIDPLNIASAFIPVVGEARYAQLLARAGGSALARGGVRAGVGAVEGFVGAAALEPIVYGLAQDLQKDYTMADSLLNLAFGTVLGGGLHVGVGVVRDHVSAGRSVETTPPKGEIPQTIAAMTPEQRMEIGRVALAQAIEGRAVDVEALMPAARGADTSVVPGRNVDAAGRTESVDGPVRVAEQTPDVERIREAAVRSNSPEARVNPDDARASSEAQQTLAVEAQPKAAETGELKEVEIQNKAMTEEMRALEDTAKAMDTEMNPKEFEAFDERIKETDTLTKAMRALAACQSRNS